MSALETLLYHLVFVCYRIPAALGLRRAPKTVRVEDFITLDAFRKEF